jgi:hypothetical protein
VVRVSDCQYQSRKSPGFDPSGIREAADEAVLNTVKYGTQKKSLNKFKNTSVFPRNASVLP